MGSRGFCPVYVLRMFFSLSDDGRRQALIKKGKRFLALAAIAVTLSGVFLANLGTSTIAAGETRTISLYHTNTKESLTVTYMVNGRYVPSAMKQLNYLLRDWRRNEVITIDPRVIDLVWELHADLGSRAPINIVCGYRSAATNGFLKRIGRGVAKKSQHILGKAIDINFPDVPTRKIRNIALVRQFGGVGYYPTSGPRGFVHVDSGNVRQWGPTISSTEMAQIFSEGRRVISARLARSGNVMVASNETRNKPVNASSVYDALDAGDDEELTNLSEEASKEHGVNTVKPKLMTSEVVALNNFIPKPRTKPIEVLIMAAANMIIEPASALPSTEVIRTKPSMIAKNIGFVQALETITEETKLPLTSNTEGKGSFADALRDGTAKGAPLIKPLMASADGSDIVWWPETLIFNPDQTIRRNGAPQAFTTSDNLLIPTAQAQAVPSINNIESSSARADNTQDAGSGKGVLLVVQRDGKGSLPIALPNLLQSSKKIGQL